MFMSTLWKNRFFETVPWAKSLHAVMRLFHPVMVGLALIGIIWWFKGYFSMRGVVGQLPVPQTMLLIVLVYYTALHALFAGLPRYSIPLRPELYLVAVWVACRLLSTIRGRLIRLKE